MHGLSSSLFFSGGLFGLPGSLTECIFDRKGCAVGVIGSRFLGLIRLSVYSEQASECLDGSYAAWVNFHADSNVRV